MRCAGLSIDLDDLWTYRRSFGFEDWTSYPSFLAVAIPRVIALLGELDCRATAFLVGHDAGLARNRPPLQALADCGVEIGNHSYWHAPALQSQSADFIDRELADAEEAILQATGHRPLGFRGPAFSMSRTLLGCLMARNYRYDASTFPSSIGPLARAYQGLIARRATATEQGREKLYGGFRAATGSLHPYYWGSGEQRLLEIPVTTMPLSRLPMHMTYLHFIADRSPALARRYFRTALWLCRRLGIAPSLLLHATDFIGGDDSYPLACIPGMQRTAAEKIALTRELLQHCQDSFELTGLAEFAARFDTGGLAVKSIDVQAIGNAT